MFENLQGFFESTAGKIAVTAVILVFFAVILIPSSKEKDKTQGTRPDTKALTISSPSGCACFGTGTA